MAPESRRPWDPVSKDVDPRLLRVRDGRRVEWRSVGPLAGDYGPPSCRLPPDPWPTHPPRHAELSGRLATAIVGRYRERFGRGPTESKAYVTDDVAFVVLRNAQTNVERSLVAGGELDSVELLRRLRRARVWAPAYGAGTSPSARVRH
jgi:Na+-translocating membrane potential-generating system (MpsC)